MNKNMTFEQANAKLEETVRNMENNALTLQESVEQYAQACELLSYCMKVLETSKGRIEDINEMLNNIQNKESGLLEE